MKLTRLFPSVALTLAISMLGCSSSEDAPSSAQPINARTGSAAHVRSQLARAIVQGARVRSETFRRDVEAWTARLSDDAICAASQRAQERPVMTLGVDIAGAARREIVFDLSTRETAVYTKASGELADDRAHLFASSDRGHAVPMPVDDESDGRRISALAPEVARGLRAMVGPDGSPYGEAYALSETATRAFAKAAPSKIAPDSGLDAAGAMAATVLAWAGLRDPIAIKAALLAVVASEADSSRVCDLSTTAMKTSSLHVLSDQESSFDFDDAIAAWLDAVPAASDAADSFETETAASCATDPSMACAGSQVCTTAADSYCCAEPRPVTKACTYEGDCGEGESCVLASNEPDSDGNMLTCADVSGSACAALSGAAQTTRGVSLKYEGTCDFLRSCSTWSKNLAAGTVRWGCEGVASCSDSDRWVAAPSRSYCGKTVQFCKGGTCTTAKVRDVSVSRDWEGSNGVMDALDLPHGLAGRCSGYGGGKVTVRVL